MDKIKDLVHGGHKKEQDHTSTTATTGTHGTHDTHGTYGTHGTQATTATHGTHGTAPPAAGYGYGEPAGTHQEGTGEKKQGLMGKIGGKLKGGSSSSSSSSSDEDREGARDRNRIRREKRAQRKAGGVRGAGGAVPVGTTTGAAGVPYTGPVDQGHAAGEKKHGFFG